MNEIWESIELGGNVQFTFFFQKITTTKLDNTKSNTVLRAAASRTRQAMVIKNIQLIALSISSMMH